MKTVPIVPAPVERTADGIADAAASGGRDPRRSDAEAQARHVFLAGNGLPARWQGRDRFTVLETDFGLGHGFLVAWDAWRRDLHRCGRLGFVSIALHPPARDTLAAFYRDDPTLGDLAARLAAAWPPATPNLHRLAFEDGRVELLLALGDTTAWLRELEVAADAFFLDDGAGTAGIQDPRHWKALGRLAAPDASLAVSSASPAVRQGLAVAGFEVRPGAGGDLVHARFRPVHAPRLPARRSLRPATECRALIVGGGLAGTAAAAALAERGWRSTLFERHATLAAEASGNPGGLFHGTVHADDGVPARFARAASLAAVEVVERALGRHGASGSVGGLLRLEPRLSLSSMQALLARSGLPATYVEAVDAGTASALAGLALPGPAWHYPGGGWVDPAGLVRAHAARAGDRLAVRTGVDVASIRSAGGRWQVLDAAGATIDEAGTLVLANADGALRLLGQPDWPVGRVRGQISVLPRASVPALFGNCRLPVAGSGYLIPMPGGLLFGATRQPGDGDASVRRADHASNVGRLETLVGVPLGIDPDSLGGRTAWRCAARDRLPLIGPVPALGILRGERAVEPRWVQPRHVPREPGLFLFSALGARGITVSALGAQVLAAGITGTAVPLESSLVDAIDPARFVSRGARFATGSLP